MVVVAHRSKGDGSLALLGRGNSLKMSSILMSGTTGADLTVVPGCDVIVAAAAGGVVTEDAVACNDIAGVVAAVVVDVIDDTVLGVDVCDASDVITDAAAATSDVSKFSSATESWSIDPLRSSDTDGTLLLLETNIYLLLIRKSN